MKYVAVVGGDGKRLVAWGVGGAATMKKAIEDAREDAFEWLDPADEWEAEKLPVIEINADQAKRIEAGEVALSDLGIELSDRVLAEIVELDLA